MRLAAESEGGRCVGSIEIDKRCIDTYQRNFGDDPTGDITEIDPRSISNHDLLLAGFPCQAFSIAGLKGGFEDTRGTLFRNVAEIISEKRPDAFILENVKGLVSHDKRNTLAVILNTLIGDPVNYHLVQPSGQSNLKGYGWSVLNALDFGVPQNRERIFIVGFKDPMAADRFRFPGPITPAGVGISLQEVLEDGPKWKTPVHARHFISEKYLQGLKRHRDHHESIGQGFGFEVRDHHSYANALVGGGMGRERNLVKAQMGPQVGTLDTLKSPRNGENLRRMTPREWARLQGFPEWFETHDAETHAYKQFGNSVAVPNVAAVVRAVRAAIEGTELPENEPSAGLQQMRFTLPQA
jgi:DNA (cytosine-5)-methyltransferase 1